LSIVWPVFVVCLFCTLYRLCLSFVFSVHCIVCVCPLSFLSRQMTNTGNTMDKKDKRQTQAI
jgi:hypothetical protein